MATLTKFQSWLRPNKVAPVKSGTKPTFSTYGFIFSDKIEDWMTSGAVRNNASYKAAKPRF